MTYKVHSFSKKLKNTDDHIPTDDGIIEISIHIASEELLNDDPEHYAFLVTVSNNDAFCLGREFFKKTDLYSALNLFDTLVTLENITIQSCLELSLKSY